MSKDFKYKLGVTTGLHYVARDPQLATSLAKLGFGLTRGTRAIEIALDVPHEVTETEGKSIRDVAKKQGIEVLVHGSLTMPIDLPERSDWRDAQNHMEKSVRSAIRAGGKYVDFHASLNIWLELMTYAGRKLTMAFVDHEGRFISHILKESPDLRRWFIKHRGSEYAREIFSQEERARLNQKISIDFTSWKNDEIERRLSAIGADSASIDHVTQVGRFPDIRIGGERAVRMVTELVQRGQSREQAVKEVEERARASEELYNRGKEEVKRIDEDSILKRADIEEDSIAEILEEKLSTGSKWDSEELRGTQGVLDGYHIMANYMFLTKDPMWVEMAKLYPTLTERYGMDYGKKEWLHDAWLKAEKENDRVFKTFFYGVVAAKFLEGHLKKLFQWMQDDGPEGLLSEPWISGNPLLKRYASELMMAIESPDARDAQHAGLHTLWETKQIYTAVKVIRRELTKAGLPGDRVWMLADFEHVATQGVDPVVDLEENLLKIAPDLGRYVISIHANAPNPMHAHEPLELGDVRVYKFLYYLRKTGFGKGRDVYVIYERGGGDDPFQRSIEALRLMLRFVQKDVHPDKLKDYPEFWGYRGAVAGDERRQLQMIREHAWEPLKDLIEMPDEEFGMLGRTAIQKGKRPEQWKRAEHR